MRNLILTSLALLLAGATARAGDAPAKAPEAAPLDGLSAEQFLPLAKGRDGYQPAAAWGGDVFLVAWKSGHIGEGDLRQGIKYVGELVACRVDKSGKRLEAKPFVVCAAPDLQERPRMAFGSGVFLVVWQDLRNEKDWDVYAARVTPEGKVLDKDGFLVSGGAHNQALPEVAWDGKAFQVVWQDYRSGRGYQVYGARVGANGKVLDPQGSLLAPAKAPYNTFSPLVAGEWAGGRALLFYRGSQNRQNKPQAACQWIAGGATAGGLTYDAERNSRKAPCSGTLVNFPMCLSAGPEGFLGAWTTNVGLGRGNAANDSQAAVFSREGKLQKLFLLAGEGRWSAGPYRHRIRNPAAAWAGGKFVAAWDQHNDINHQKAAGAGWPLEMVWAAEVGADGSVTSRGPVSGTPTEPAIKPCVASDGAGTTLIAYEKHPATTEVPIKIGFRMLTAK